MSNTLLNNGGIYLRTDQRADSTTNTIIDNVQILSNKVSNTNNLRGAYIGDISAQVSKETTFGVGVLGLEIRDNTLTAHTPNTQPNTTVDEAIFEGYNNLVRYQYGGAFSVRQVNRHF